MTQVLEENVIPTPQEDIPVKVEKLEDGRSADTVDTQFIADGKVADAVDAITASFITEHGIDPNVPFSKEMTEQYIEKLSLTQTLGNMSPEAQAELRETLISGLREKATQMFEPVVNHMQDSGDLVEACMMFCDDKKAEETIPANVRVDYEIRPEQTNPQQIAAQEKVDEFVKNEGKVDPMLIPRQEGEIDLIKEVTLLFEKAGHKEPNRWLNAPMLKPAMSANSLRQRFLINRFWRSELLSRDIDLRSRAIFLHEPYEENVDTWLTDFEQKIIPTIIEMDLPIFDPKLI